MLEAVSRAVKHLGRSAFYERPSVNEAMRLDLADVDTPGASERGARMQIAGMLRHYLFCILQNTSVPDLQRGHV